MGMGDSLSRVVEKHIERHLGPPSEVFHELVSFDAHIDVHLVPPSNDRPFYTLVTSGMSELPMPVPDELEGQVCPRVELMLRLPSTWELKETDDPTWNWPLKWLHFLARYPAKFGAWIWVGHTIPNSEDCDPFAANTDQCCWFVRLPSEPEQFVEMTHGDRTVVFLSLTAIYQNEMEFALADDAAPQKLNQLLDQAGVDELINPDRLRLSI